MTSLSSPEGVVAHLAELVSDEARQRLYGTIDKNLELVRALKAEVDRYKDQDAVKALHLGTCALELSGFVDHPEAVPLGLWAYALGLTVQGRFAEALPHFDRARALYQAQAREAEAARVAMRQIQALAMTGAFEAALSLAEETRQVLYEHGLERDALTVENNMGIIYLRLGRLEEAEAILEHALSGFDALGASAGMVLAYVNLGDVCQLRDGFTKAEHYLEQATRLAQRLGQNHNVARSMINLALLYRRLGRQSDALRLLSQVRALYRRAPSEPDAALAELEEARIHLDLNLLTEAAAIATDLVKTFGARDMVIEQAEALQVLGMARMRQGDPALAVESLEAARANWQVVGHRLQTALTDLDLAAAHHARGQTDQALVTVRTGLAVLEESGTRSSRAAGYLLYAKMLLAAGDVPEAQACLECAELLSELSPDLDFRLHTLKGELALERGQIERAKTCFEKAVSRLEGVHGDLPVREYRAAYLSDKLGAYEALIALHLASDDIATAFSYVERAKAHRLAPPLEDAPADVPGMDADSADLARRLKQAKETLNWHLLGPEETLKARQATIRASEREVLRLSIELERLNPGRGPRGLTAPPDLARLQQSLDHDTVWVEYFSLKGQLSALVITRDEARYTGVLGSEQAVAEASKWLAFYLHRSALGESFLRVYGKERLKALVDGALERLYSLLIAGLGLETHRKLVIAPCGALFNIPFAALYNGESYIADARCLSLVPSASYHLPSEAAVAGDRGGLSAFGLSQDLPGVEAELGRVVHACAEAALYLDAEATLQAFFRRAPKSEILHIATHGVFRPDNPMFSSLRFQDGWLRARDLYGTRLAARLVVLSACQSGVVRRFHGDELFGLVRGFLDAGAGALVTTLWPVKDAQTADFMSYFYDGLRTGLATASALRQAQRLLRESHPNPYYWAAFTVMGKGYAQVDLGT